MSGLFIAFEGGEGAGKSTQARRLADALSERGYCPVLLREPGSTELGEYLREYLVADRLVSPSAELLLFEAARAQLMAEKVIEPLEAGSVVLGRAMRPARVLLPPLPHQGRLLVVDDTAVPLAEVGRVVAGRA